MNHELLLRLHNDEILNISSKLFLFGVAYVREREGEDKQLLQKKLADLVEDREKYLALNREMERKAPKRRRDYTD